MAVVCLDMSAWIITAIPYITCKNRGTVKRLALQSKAYVCDRLIAGIAGSNPAENVDVRLLCVL